MKSYLVHSVVGPRIGYGMNRSLWSAGDLQIQNADLGLGRDTLSLGTAFLISAPIWQNELKFDM